jgi:very-short-patch-repair endonuclease
VLGGEVAVSLSALERRFLGLLDAAGVPRPVTNRVAGTKRVDCRWPELRLTVELDSFRFHNSRHSWEQDRRRDREARARGDELLRFTYADVTERPMDVVAELRVRAASRTSGGPPAPR